MRQKMSILVYRSAAAMLSAKLVKNAELKIYPGGSHGVCTTEMDKVNGDLLEFVKS